MEELCRCNEEIAFDEISVNVGKLERGKSPGLDDIMVEYLKIGGGSLMEWLVRILSPFPTDGTLMYRCINMLLLTFHIALYS